MNSVWVLTREINAYDQDGAYFVRAFRDRPTAQQVHTAGVPLAQAMHVANGGGRISPHHDEWWYLREEPLS